MSLIGSYISPHPPIVIPEIGRGEENNALNTINGMKYIAADISEKKPDTIILITPHGPVFEDAICISTEENLYGDLGKFGFKNINFQFRNDIELAKEIILKANNNGIVTVEVDRDSANRYGISTDVDHGALVPLYFVNEKNNNYKLVHITMGMLPYHELYRFGMSISDALSDIDEKVVVIASADLSHRLTQDAPAGFNPRGKEFDEKLVSLIKNNEIENILSMDRVLIDCAGECGFRPIVIMLGILDKYNVIPSVISYEGPFGVGYATARYEILSKKDEGLYKKIIQNEENRIKSIRSLEDDYVRLARQSLEAYVKEGKVIDIPEDISKEMIENKAGVFVSLKKDGNLRGCIGTISATRKNIAVEIIYNAISAGIQDPRFYPVEKNELDKIAYSVDILNQAESIKSKSELDVKKYGVIVKKGNRSGLLLPNLEGVDSIDEQISIALNKAGIDQNEEYSMKRFEVVRHGTK